MKIQMPGNIRKVHFLSVVIPFFNEEENVPLVLRELEAELSRLGLPHEVIAVDDGSTDETWVCLCALKEEMKGLRVVKLRRNFGQTHALAAGIESARGDWILTLDGDGQNDLSGIGRLVETAQNGADVVSGWRKKRKDSKIIRTLPSRVANWLIAKITGLKLHDSGCALKLYRADAVRSISFYAERHRFLPFLIHMRGYLVKEIEVGHRPRSHGKSKYGISRVYKVFLDLIALALFARFKECPRFYFFLSAGPLFAIAGFSVAASMFRVSVNDTSSLVGFHGIALLTAFCGLWLVAAGLLAEWMVNYEHD